MENIWNCRLFNTLITIKDRCALLTGRKSLLALENYINGYIDACTETAPSCYTLNWYHEFLAYLSQICKVDYEKFNIFSAISALGYDDESGVDFFMEKLSQFSETYERMCSKGSSEVMDLKVARIFCIDKHRATELIGRVIEDKREEFFGAIAHEQGRSIVLTWLDNDTLLCALCRGSEAEAALSAESCGVSLIREGLRVFSLGEKITATDIKL